MFFDVYIALIQDKDWKILGTEYDHSYKNEQDAESDYILTIAQVLVISSVDLSPVPARNLLRVLVSQILVQLKISNIINHLSHNEKKGNFVNINSETVYRVRTVFHPVKFEDEKQEATETASK